MASHDGKTTEVAEGVFWLPIGWLSGNVYFVRAGPSWALIDTGRGGQGALIKRAAEAVFGPNLLPVGIFLTHAHPDHCGSALELARAWGCPVYLHPDELPLVVDRRLETVERFANPLDRWIILPLLRAMPRRRVALLLERESLAEVARPLAPDAPIPELPGWLSISAPGHAPGHVVFFREADRVLLSGDAIVTTVLDTFWRSLLYALLPARPRLSGPPPYTTFDGPKAKATIAALARLEPSVLATGHGIPLRGPEAPRLLRAFADRFCAA